MRDSGTPTTRWKSKSPRRVVNLLLTTDSVEQLRQSIPTAQHLHRAILRTGTSLIEKNQIRHLNAFRMCLVKDGPDVKLFTHPAALTKLALWVGEAVAQKEREKKGKLSRGGRGTPFVIGGLNESRGVYVVVGTGGGGGMGFSDRVAVKEREERKRERERRRTARQHARQHAKQKEKQKKREERVARRGDADNEHEHDSNASDISDTEEEEEEEEDDDDDEEADEEEHSRGYGRNRFGNAFQEVVEETKARVRIDSFEHCVVEVKKDDLAGFLESLSMKVVIG